MGVESSVHGQDEKCVQILIGKPEGKCYLEDLGIGGSIILKMDLRSVGRRV
jgi:hypothetical protein